MQLFTLTLKRKRNLRRSKHTFVHLRANSITVIPDIPFLKGLLDMNAYILKTFTSETEQKRRNPLEV